MLLLAIQENFTVPLYQMDKKFHLRYNVFRKDENWVKVSAKFLTIFRKQYKIEHMLNFREEIYG